MSRLVIPFLCLAVALGVAEVTMGAEVGSNTFPVPVPAANRAFPLAPLPPLPPVAQFNQLLRASPVERTNQLVGKSRAARDLILRELAAVDAMSVVDREQKILRLRMAQLRFYLVPLMRGEVSNRVEQLARVPGEDRALLEARLVVWDKMSTLERREVLESESALQLFVGEATTRSTQDDAGRSGTKGVSPEVAQVWEMWQRLPESERVRREATLRKFFDLSSDDQTRILGMLPDRERRRMDLTLRQYSILSPEKREQCVRNFDQLARLPEASRDEFLRNAAKWQAMSQAERDAWRRLVLPLPPLPPISPGGVAGPK